MEIFVWIEKGGFVMKILLILNVIGWSLLIWKVLGLFLFFKNLESHAKKVRDSFKEYDFNKMKFSDREQLNYALSYYMDKMYRGLSTIKIIAIISPLLGLLGTVLGILTSFQIISEKGLSDPSLFASGISLALITTVGGLIVAIPHFIGHNYISANLTKAERSLERYLLSSVKA